MEDGRYRVRHTAGLEAADTASNLVSSAPGTVLYEHIVKHQSIEVQNLCIDVETAIAAIGGTAAVLRIDKVPAGGGAAVDQEVYLTVPEEGVAAYTGYIVETNRNTSINGEDNRPVFVRGDRLRIVVHTQGVTTAQAARPYVLFRELKNNGVAEGVGG